MSWFSNLFFQIQPIHICNRQSIKFFHTFITEIDILYGDISHLFMDHLEGTKTRKFSSTMSMQDFQKFKLDITADLADFYYKSPIRMLIDGYAKNYIRNVLNQHYQTIINAFEQELQYLFDSYQQTYSLEERSHIADCIHSECVFNLTNEPIPKELSEFISKGSKYVPYTKTLLRISKKRFDECFCKTANRIVS